jgi:protein TonB
MFNKPGGGGVGVGDNSPFGDQFGWYAQRLIEQVGQHWQTAGLDSRARPAVVTFTIKRDGSVTGVKLSQSSGNMAVDLSAQRAFFDAQFPPLPPQFPGGSATLDMRFVLQ